MQHFVKNIYCRILQSGCMRSINLPDTCIVYIEDFELKDSSLLPKKINNKNYTYLDILVGKNDWVFCLHCTKWEFLFSRLPTAHSYPTIIQYSVVYQISNIALLDVYGNKILVCHLIKSYLVCFTMYQP